MKHTMILGLGVLLIFLVGILSFPPVGATDQKITKSLITVEKKNLSPNLSTTIPILKKEAGSTLFDGTQILQSKAVIASALEKMKAQEVPQEDEIPSASPTPTGPVEWWNWELRDFADYVASNASHTITYSFVQTDGAWMGVSSGVLGFSVVSDQIIGDKFDLHYQFTVDNAVETGFFLADYQYRVTILPDENEILVQSFREGSPSPVYEYRTALVDTHAGGDRKCYYGITSGGNPVLTLSLRPEPLPDSAT